MYITNNRKGLPIALAVMAVMSSFNATAQTSYPAATDPTACQRTSVRNNNCAPWSHLTLKSNPNAWKYDISQIGNTVPHQKRWYHETVTRVVLLEGIEFDFDKYNILDLSYPIMEKNVDALKSSEVMRVKVVGHTDAKGSGVYNQNLSEQRAASAMNFFRARGVDMSRVTSYGRGESQPVALNQNSDGSDNPEGRQRNRRIELHITSK